MVVVGRMQSGFTLIEVMSVVMITSFLALAAAPMAKNYSLNREVTEIQLQFAKSLNRARERAVLKDELVSVCGSRDGRTCSQDAWAGGWLVYRASTEGVSQPTLERIVEAYQVQEDVGWALNVADQHNTPLASIQFDARGYNTHSGRISAGFCRLSDNTSVPALEVQRSGRIVGVAEGSFASKESYCKS